MRKKTIAVICMLTLIMLSDIGVIAAEQPEIKNLNFQIPDVWEYSSESIEDDVALYYYKTENETLLIQCVVKPLALAMGI
ncbi:MAG: hypothetical protein Q4E91_12550 [Lachnospiraceae bacterium]|nr:hypothetical protein [Lachnospiraceae bacterium]